MYRVELSREAERFFVRCDTSMAKRLARCLTALENNPRAGANIKGVGAVIQHIAGENNPRAGANIKALQGPFAGSHRYRVGDHRVIYTIDEHRVMVFVIAIANRKDAYR